MDSTTIRNEAAPRMASRRVLVVEDNPDTAATMALLLEVGRHFVRVASAGREALDMVRSWQPEVVLCDIALPGELDGYEVARAIRHDPAAADVYLVALSGYGRADDRRRSREAGFDAHLTKPVEPEVLEQLLCDLDPGTHN